MKYLVILSFFITNSASAQKPISLLKNGYLFQVEQKTMLIYLGIPSDSSTFYSQQLDSLVRAKEYFSEKEIVQLQHRAFDFRDLLFIPDPSLFLPEHDFDALTILDATTKLPIDPKYKTKKIKHKNEGMGGYFELYLIIIDKKKHTKILEELMHRSLPC